MFRSHKNERGGVRVSRPPRSNISYGVLPYAKNPKGDVVVLLGMENKTFSLFRGGKEKDETPQQAACRELHEESCGVLSTTPESVSLKYDGYGFPSKKGKRWIIGAVKFDYDILSHAISQFDDRRNAIHQQYIRDLQKNISNEERLRLREEMFHKLEKMKLKLFTINSSCGHEKTDAVISWFKETGEFS